MQFNRNCTCGILYDVIQFLYSSTTSSSSVPVLSNLSSEYKETKILNHLCTVNVPLELHWGLNGTRTGGNEDQVGD